MKKDMESQELALRLWRQMYQTYTLFKTCEDKTYGDYGLTTEQAAVLGAIDYFGGPMKITDIARWLERSTNSMSMIVDRMVKAGLTRRTRSTSDRREVRVTSTSRAQDAIRPANRATFEVIQKILSPLSREDRITLLSLLGTVKYRIIEYLNPGADVEKVKKNELRQATDVKKWLSEYVVTSTGQTKRQREKKGKTRR